MLEIAFLQALSSVKATSKEASTAAEFAAVKDGGVAFAATVAATLTLSKPIP